MRYPAHHKDTARQHLLRQGGSHAKQHGFGESGMAAIAASAGVTTGALYKHFDGKADYFAELIAAEMARTAALFGSIAPGDRGAVAALLARYLGLPHVRHPAQGCPLPALTPEIARADAPVRDAFGAGLHAVHAALATLVGSPERAWSLLALASGAVMLARALPDGAAQQQALLAAARQSVTALLDGPPAAPAVARTVPSSSTGS